MLIVFPLGLLGTSLLFVVSWLLRRDDPTSPEGLAIGLGALAVALSLVTGWLGGELVDRLGVGVDEGANVDAPSSLSGRPAGERSRSSAVRTGAR